MKHSEQTSDTKYGTNLGQNKILSFFYRTRVRWRENDSSVEVKKDKEKVIFCAGFIEPYVGSHRLIGDWSLTRQVSCVSEIPLPFPLISPFLWCWPREAHFIPHCTPEESAVMGAGLVLPAPAVCLPIGSSLLISSLLPSRGLL